MIPLNPVLVIEILDCWDIDFMGPFLLLVIFIFFLPLNVSKWVEVMLCRTNDNTVVVKFLKENILFRYGTPHVIIIDQGTHFCNRYSKALMNMYDVQHKVSIADHL